MRRPAAAPGGGRGWVARAFGVGGLSLWPWLCLLRALGAGIGLCFWQGAGACRSHEPTPDVACPGFKCPPPGLPERTRALQALASADRATRALASAAAASVAALQPAADALGAALGLTGSNGRDGGGPAPGVTAAAAAAAVQIFSEEEVRSGAAAALSNLVAALQPRLLALAGASGWQVISRGAGAASGSTGAPAAVGPLLRVSSLSAAPAAIAAAAAAGMGLMGHARPIIIVDRIRGDEDVPPGCGAVVVLGSCPDVLCHAAVRARGAGVPLVSCLDAREAARVTSLEGRAAALRVRGEAVELSEASDADLAGAAEAVPPGGAATGGAAAAAAAAVAGGEWNGEWVVGLDGFEPGVVGAKSANTRRLARALPAWLRAPASAAVPLGAFEGGVMRDPANAAAAAAVRELEGRLTGGPDDDKIFAEIRRAGR